MLAAATDFATGVPRRIAQALTSTLPITRVELPVPPMRLAMQLQWSERTHPDVGSRFFRELLREKAREESVRDTLPSPRPSPRGRGR